MKKEMAFAFIMFSLLSVSAASAETIVTTDVIAESVCPCSTIGGINDLTVTIENTGDTDETYMLELLVPDLDTWTGFINPDSIHINAGIEHTEAFFVTPSCFIVPGVYDLSVKATDSSGAEVITDFQIEVGKCRWVAINAEDYEACQGKATAFELEFVNEGESNEVVTIAADKEWVSFSEETFSISAGESRMIDVLLMPTDEVEGLVDVQVSLESEGYAKNVEVFTVDVKRCYGTDFDVYPLRVDLCPCETAEFSLSITNNGLLEDQYTVKYGGQEDKLLLDSGAEGMVTLFIEVPCEKEAGEYPVPIEIDSNSPIMSSVTVGVYPLDSCYAASLETDEKALELDVGSSAAAMLTLTNNGMFSQTYAVDVEGPEWVYLSMSEISIDPEETKTIYAYIAPEYGVEDDNYIAEIKASAGNEESSIALDIHVVSGFASDDTEEVTEETPEETVEEPDETPEEAEESEPEAEIGIPTGEVIGEDSEGSEERPWSQIMMISILAIGVVLVLVLRFVIMLK